MRTALGKRPEHPVSAAPATCSRISHVEPSWTQFFARIASPSHEGGSGQASGATSEFSSNQVTTAARFMRLPSGHNAPQRTLRPAMRAALADAQRNHSVKPLVSQPTACAKWPRRGPGLALADQNIPGRWRGALLGGWIPWPVPSASCLR